jgi:hypothetical protein
MWSLHPLTKLTNIEVVLAAGSLDYPTAVVACGVIDLGITVCFLSRGSSVLDVRSFRGADCDTDHYLVVAKVRERLAVSKQAAQKFDAERFNLKKLSELEVRKQYQLKISNRFAALENLNFTEDINRAWENIKENIKISAQESLGLHEQKQFKPWFDAECAEFSDKRKQAKIQWLQNPNQNNGDNLHNVQREASRHFRNKKKEYLKAKINELETNSKNRNIRDLYRGINEFKRGYQPRTSVVKDEKGDLFADSHSILARWRNHFSQLLNIHVVNDRQTEVHAAEPLVPEPSAFEVEVAIEKQKDTNHQVLIRYQQN